MTGVSRDLFFHSVAKECADGAAKLHHVQSALETRSVDMAEVENLQSLDIVHQLLTDFSQLFGSLANAAPESSAAIPASVLMSVKQESLRARLVGDRPDADASTDIF